METMSNLQPLVRPFVLRNFLMIKLIEYVEIIDLHKFPSHLNLLQYLKLLHLILLYNYMIPSLPIQNTSLVILQEIGLEETLLQYPMRPAQLDLIMFLENYLFVLIDMESRGRIATNHPWPLQYRRWTSEEICSLNYAVINLSNVAGACYLYRDSYIILW